MDETAVELPRALQLMWGIEGPARPGPKPTLHISDIGAGRGQARRRGRARRGLDEQGGGRARLHHDVALPVRRFQGRAVRRDARRGVRAAGADRPGAGLAGADHRLGADALPGRACTGTPGCCRCRSSSRRCHRSSWTGWSSACGPSKGHQLSPADQLSAMVLVNIYVRGTAQLTADMFVGGERTKEENDQLYGRRLMMLATPDRFPTIAANHRIRDAGRRRRFRLGRLHLRPDRHPRRHPGPDRPQRRPRLRAAGGGGTQYGRSDVELVGYSSEDRGDAAGGLGVGVAAAAVALADAVEELDQVLDDQLPSPPASGASPSRPTAAGRSAGPAAPAHPCGPRRRRTRPSAPA